MMLAGLEGCPSQYVSWFISVRTSSRNENLRLSATLLFGVPAMIFITILHLSISFPSFLENLSPRRFHNRTRAPTGWPMRRGEGQFFYLHSLTADFFRGPRSYLLGHVFFSRAWEVYRNPAGHSFPTSPLWVYSLSFLSCVQISKVHEIPTEWLFLGYLAATPQCCIKPDHRCYQVSALL
jgi:hypothetical protein